MITQRLINNIYLKNNKIKKKYLKILIQLSTVYINQLLRISNY